MTTRILDRGWMMVAGAAAALLVSSTPATAQQSADGPRWQAWLGCWVAAGEATGAAEAQPRDGLLCVIPAEGDEAVEVVTVAAGEVESRFTIRADGAQYPAEREGCTGWESAVWSQDGSRVFLSSQFDCNGLQRSTSGVMGFSPTGNWLDVQAVAAGGNSGVQVAQYRPAASNAQVPANIRAAIADRTMATSAARVAAAARIDEADVIEAARLLDDMALEAWLMERDQAIRVDAAVLTRLDDANVPSRVIDLLVALDYPEVFAVDNTPREPSTRYLSSPMWDPWYGSYYGGYYPYGYGYYGYGRRYGGWYGGYPSTIIIRRPDAGEPDNNNRGGRVVRGEGYRRGGSDAGSAQPTQRPSSGGSPSVSSGSSGGSSGGSTSTPARTARPKN